MLEQCVFICKAFPEGIPSEVVWNEILHDENIEGDNGFKYEEKVLSKVRKKVDRSLYLIVIILQYRYCNENTLILRGVLFFSKKG